MIFNYELEKNKMHSDKRVFKLKLKEGVSAKTSAGGQVDNRLFKGDNYLFAKKEPITGLWKCSYEKGSVQEPLKQSFTSFNELKRYVTDFFNKRNVVVEDVEDAFG